MVIVSNGVDQAKQGSRLRIEGYFHVIIGSAHVGFRKPIPEIFQLALSKIFGTPPEQAVMVGDNWEADVVGAQVASIKGIYLSRGGEPSPNPDAIIDIWVC